MKIDKYSGLQIDEVWPVSKRVRPNGGFGVYWSERLGCYITGIDQSI